MGKYVMLAINGKQPTYDEIYVRRVLLEYKGRKFKIVGLAEIPACYYMGTRFVEKDDYFKDPAKSTQYVFKDDRYVLTSTNHFRNEPLVGEEREYHAFVFDTDDPYYQALRPIEFEAATDEEAIEIFNDRKELR